MMCSRFSTLRNSRVSPFKANTGGPAPPCGKIGRWPDTGIRSLKLPFVKRSWSSAAGQAQRGQDGLRRDGCR
jgi:hypothetical protein